MEKFEETKQTFRDLLGSINSSRVVTEDQEFFGELRNFEGRKSASFAGNSKAKPDTSQVVQALI
jgi:hypothetical protein